MKMNKATKFVAVALVCLTSMAGVAPRVEAMVVPAETVSGVAQMDRAQDLKAITAALENKVVRQRLTDLGLTTTQIEARLGKLSNDQIHQVAMQIEQQSAAAGEDDDELLIGLAIGAILIALIVWIIKVLD